MQETQNERISINGRILQYGVLSKDANYQVYLFPGMTVAEIAFCTMVTIRLLMKDGYLDNKEDFDKLVDKYYNDPQYAPVDKESKDESK